ncbi:MAG: EAL domain-containing protein [Gaiellaceae bacterium]
MANAHRHHPVFFVREREATSGSVLRRRLLPGATFLVLAIGVARWAGERAELYGGSVGVALYAAAALIGVSALILYTSRTLDRAEGDTRKLIAAYEDLVNELPLVIYVDDASDNSSNIYTSPQVEAMFGYTVEEWTTDPELFVKMLHPDDRERVLAEIRVTNESGDHYTCEYRLVGKDGRVTWVLDQSSHRLDASGTPLYSQGYLLDITQRREAEEQLRQLAWRDSLTGLANRARMMHELQARFERGGRTSLLFLDLDDFKTVNDSLGHAAGDKLLVEVGERLSRSVRSDSLVARIGGDEFGILIPDADDAAVEGIARRMQHALGAPFHLGETAVRPSGSIGIANCGHSGELLRNADIAMYAAKASGAGGYRFFEPEMHEAASSRLALLGDLRAPGLLDQLALQYQPTYDLRSGKIESLEALVRWNHPTRGLIAPGDFIPLAEENLAIGDIGRWVLRTACRQISTWRAEHHLDVKLAVNVSPVQLRDPGFFDELATTLADTAVPPTALRLELTERVILGADTASRRNLTLIDELGVAIALDDFGVGTTGIGYLQDLPLSILKIDRTYIDGIGGGNTKLLEGIFALAHELDLAVIAEGIEDAGQLEALRRLQCPVGQGFYLSRPVDASAVGELLEQRSSPADHLRVVGQ